MSTKKQKLTLWHPVKPLFEGRAIDFTGLRGMNSKRPFAFGGYSGESLKRSILYARSVQTLTDTATPS